MNSPTVDGEGLDERAAEAPAVPRLGNVRCASGFTASLRKRSASAVSRRLPTSTWTGRNP